MWNCLRFWGIPQLEIPNLATRSYIWSSGVAARGSRAYPISNSMPINVKYNLVLKLEDISVKCGLDLIFNNKFEKKSMGIPQKVKIWKKLVTKI